MPCDQNGSDDHTAQCAGGHGNAEARQIESHRQEQRNDDNRGADSAADTDSIDPDFGLPISSRVLKT
jgi:hypothetical protein